jgi:hypothetical protein
MAKKKIKKTSDAPKADKSIGKQVFYNPNGKDFSIRPKNTPAAGQIVSIYDQTITVPGDKPTEVTRTVANIVVFHDAEPGVVFKKRVPHKDDALEGECFYE